MGLKHFFLIVFVLMLSIPTSFGIFTEWWYASSSHEADTCAYTALRDLGFRVQVPANTHVRFMIPRAYMMGEEAGFMNRFHLIADIMNDNIVYVDNINECPQNMPDHGLTSSAEPPGPYICFTGNPTQASRIKIEHIMGTDEGPSHPRFENSKFAGSVFDKNNDVSGMWPAHSIFYIKEFRSMRGLIDIELETELDNLMADISGNYPQPTDCSVLAESQQASCETQNAALEADVQESLNNVEQAYSNVGLDVTENSLSRKTLAFMGLMSNGRTGVGDPWYIVIDFNNLRKRCSSNSCVERHWNEAGGFDPLGPPWESGLEGWGMDENPDSSFEADFASVSNNYFDQWEGEDVVQVAVLVAGGLIGSALYSLVDGSNFFKNIIKKKKTILGLSSSSVCVFGCHDVTLDVILGVGSRVFFAVGAHEFHGENFDPVRMGTVCSYNSPWSVEREETLDDGYAYSCDANTGQFQRYNYRVTCTNKFSTVCVIGSDPSQSQTEFINPMQFYNDIERTKDAFMSYFSHDDGSPIRAVTSPNGLDLLSHLQLYDPDNVPESVAHGVEEGFASEQKGFGILIEDFNPDSRQEICMAQGCLADWLGESGMLSSSDSDRPENSNFNPKNLCCGDDPDDVGYIQNIQGHYFSCV
ncbi:MAG: hypothetical protein ACMXYK_03525, partial [Candidatus Woesearchaeota archaeon]